MMACRRSPYQGDPRSYESYYGSQVGHGMPVFLGARVQRGHGLGNLFAGLVRAAMPLVKKGVKAIGKQGMKTGIQIAGDVFSGHKPKQAAKRRAKQAGLQLIGSALGQHPPGTRATRGRTQSRGRDGRGVGQSSGGHAHQRGRATKRKSSSHPVSSLSSKRRKDIFD